MVRAPLLVMFLCLGSEAIADTARFGQRVELQVGAPLRIIERDAFTRPEGSGEPIKEFRTIEPSYGVSPRPSGALSIKDQIVASLNLDHHQDPSLAYAVTEKVSVGIGYDFIEAEDLAANHTMDGIVDIDHQSHHLLFRALWHFD